MLFLPNTITGICSMFVLVTVVDIPLVAHVAVERLRNYLEHLLVPQVTM